MFLPPSPFSQLPALALLLHVAPPPWQVRRRLRPPRRPLPRDPELPGRAQPARVPGLRAQARAGLPAGHQVRPGPGESVRVLQVHVINQASKQRPCRFSFSTAK